MLLLKKMVIIILIKCVFVCVLLRHYYHYVLETHLKYSSSRLQRGHGTKKMSSKKAFLHTAEELGACMLVAWNTMKMMMIITLGLTPLLTKTTPEILHFFRHRQTRDYGKSLSIIRIFGENIPWKIVCNLEDASEFST